MRSGLIPNVTGLFRPRDGLWRLPFRRARENGAAAWTTRLDHVIADLESLNQTTERDFLAIGGKLMQFREATRLIASESATLTNLISDDHSRAASQALGLLLEHADRLSARVEQSGLALQRVSDLSSAIRQAFSGIRAMVSTFQAMCTLTRIETARLGNTGGDFGDLAAEVRTLSQNIQSSGEGVLSASAQLAKGLEAAICSGVGLRERQLHELPALMEGVVCGLQSFEERRRRAAESNIREAACHQALCKAVDGVVQSVQFHDITRQQIEHVIQALRQLRGLGAAAGAADAFPTDARAVLRLQSGQLDGALKVFSTSAGRMDRDLESIALRVHDSSETGRLLMGISAGDHDSFFQQMEDRFTAILDLLGNCHAAQAQIESTTAGLRQKIAQMRGSIADIRGIEIRIQWIATNALIRATHLGTAGDALNLIAEVMQRLAHDSNIKTEAVAETLEAMNQAVLGICGAEEAEQPGGAANTRAVLDGMRSAILELHSSSECSFAVVNQMSAAGEQLAAEIASARGGFTASQRFAEVVNRAREELDLICAQTGDNSQPFDSSSADHLDLHARRYTMQMERDVHQAVAGDAAIGPPVTHEPTDNDLGDNDLGDNVELF